MTKINKKNFKIPINGLSLEELVSNSQAGQDLFVIALLQGKTQGSFLEIGAGNLEFNNNTYLLEKKFAWQGWSIDLEDFHDEKHIRWFWKNFYQNVRDSSWPDDPDSIDCLPEKIQKECIDHGYQSFFPKTWKDDRPLTNFIKHDALMLDYKFLPAHVDYLQIDIDPPNSNLLLLEKILKISQFSVITFEHDFWRSNDESRFVRSMSREILNDNNYVMIANDVTIEPDKGSGIGDEPIYFEDWYANPNFVPEHIINTYQNITSNLVPKYFYDVLFTN